MGRMKQREWLAEHADRRYWVTQLGYPKPYGCRDVRIRPGCAHFIFMVAHQGKTIGELDQQAELAAKMKAEDRLSEYPGWPLIESAIAQLQVMAKVEEVLESVVDSQPRMWRQASLEIAFCAETERRWIAVFPRAKRPVPREEA